MHFKQVFLLLFLLTSSIADAESKITIIQLEGRTAEEIIPLIKPFIHERDTITGMGYQLIIRSSPTRLAEIHKILDQFDRPPRRLIIHLQQGHLAEDQQQQLSIATNADIGKHATAEAGKQTQERSIRLRTRAHRRQSDHDILQQIQTLEGKAAFIATGKLIPIQQQSYYISNGIIYPQQAAHMQNATTGFYVTPSLNKNRVTLQISPFMNRVGQSPGTMEMQQVHTVVSGQLGEWIAVAGTHQNSKQQGHGLTRFQSTQIEDNQQIYLRVEEVIDR